MMHITFGSVVRLADLFSSVTQCLAVGEKEEGTSFPSASSKKEYLPTIKQFYFLNNPMFNPDLTPQVAVYILVIQA